MYSQARTTATGRSATNVSADSCKSVLNVGHMQETPVFASFPNCLPRDTRGQHAETAEKPFEVEFVKLHIKDLEPLGAFPLCLMAILKDLFGHLPVQPVEALDAPIVGDQVVQFSEALNNIRNRPDSLQMLLDFPSVDLPLPKKIRLKMG